MSLKILFADDSVTAQNMGKKILAEAGYEVVAVSNGAAAVKKIAEQKPDIIILDVYMPGYTGLEVCEKVRGSIDTLKTPVLLTVGKMEPYKPEEANRVRADGVIVKPFEASDLLAIVKKFEERIGQAGPAPGAQRPIPVERFQETPERLEPEEIPIISTLPQATVEVPDHMATTSAFSDLLTADHSIAPLNSNKPAARETAPTPQASSAPIPDYDVPVSWRRDTDPVASSTMYMAGSEPAAEEPEPLRPRQIPVFEDRIEQRATVEVVPTAAPPTGAIEISREPHLQETAAETTRNTVADSREPGLVPTMQHETEAGTAATMAAEMAPVEDAESLPESFRSREAANEPVAPGSKSLPGPRLVARPTTLEPVDTKISESDFEARVTAAMAAYNQAMSPPPVESPEPAGARAHAARPLATQSGEPLEASKPSALETTAGGATPFFEPHLPGKADPGNHSSTGATAQETTQPAQEIEPGNQAMPETASPVIGSITSQIEAAAITATGDETGSDHTTIAQVVHRVMERLKPELVEEIVKELKSKK